MIKNSFLICLLFVVTASVAQKSINDFKYVIIDDKFDFVKETDQYQTSSLTKFLFNKYGFKAFLSSDKFPEDLHNNRCLGLYVTVKKSKGFFSIKNSIEMKDCSGVVLYESSKGTSKEKDFKAAYHEAIRIAFEDVRKLNYTYTPKMVKEHIPASKIVKAKVLERKPGNQKVKSKVITILTAKLIKGGLELYNDKNIMMYSLLQTTSKTLYLLKNKKGVCYKNGTTWEVNVYKNGKLVVDTIAIQF